MNAVVEGRQKEVRASLRLILSAASTAVGGLAGVVVFVAGTGDESDYDLGTQLWFASIAVGFHVGLAWLLAVAPLTLCLSVDSPLLRRGWAAVLGASCGVVLLCIAVRAFWHSPTHDVNAPVAWAALAACVCGAVTCELYGLLLRRESRSAPHPRPPDSTP